MDHPDTAQLAAVVGALGAVIVVLARGRALPLAGLALVGLAEAGLAWALIPTDDLRRLASGPLPLAALGAAVVLVGALAVLLVRRPELLPVAVLAAAPFRVPLTLGDQEAFLLIPLYGVLVAGTIALAVRALRGGLPDVPWLVALPLAAFVALDAVSLLWSSDLRAGTRELLFFIFPFAVLVGVIGRAPLAPWLPKALVATLAGLACAFAAIGLWQAWTREIFFARDVENVNAYTTFFRVTSVFKDPSLYGRHLVLGTAVVLVALVVGRLHPFAAAPVIALLFAGLYFAYSQSSLVALFVITFALALVAGDRRTRRVVVAAAALLALVAAVGSAFAVQGESLRRATSGRSRLVEVTARVIRDHPLIGVGVGAQPLESGKESGRARVRNNASHTTPLTVAAELGFVGLALYALLLAAAARALLLLARERRELALGLGSVLLVLFVHSLVYSGFFEDPLTWGAIALAGAALAAVPARPPTPAS